MKVTDIRSIGSLVGADGTINLTPVFEGNTFPTLVNISRYEFHQLRDDKELMKQKAVDVLTRCWTGESAFSIQRVIDVAAFKFGWSVLEISSNVILAKRQMANCPNPKAQYMIAQFRVSGSSVDFYDSRYDMDLAEATVGFYERSGAKTSQEGFGAALVSGDAWDDNAVQFPRLISEIAATVDISHSDMALLCESMDLEREDISVLFERAEVEWQSIKRKLL